jgi:hypothetical protein
LILYAKTCGKPGNPGRAHAAGFSRCTLYRSCGYSSAQNHGELAPASDHLAPRAATSLHAPPKLVYQRLLCTANNPAVFIGTSKVLQRYPHIQPSCESCYPWKVVQEKRLVLHGHRHQTWTAYGDHNTPRLGGLFDRHGFVRSSGLRNILLQRHTYPIDY